MKASGQGTSAPLIVTSGEPAGIGPDICIRLAAMTSPAAHPLVFVGDPELFADRARRLGIDIGITEYSPGETAVPESAAGAPRMTVLPVKLASRVAPGQGVPENAAAVVEMLRLAAAGCSEGRFRAVVTAPVSKALINQGGIRFSGHTEYFQERAGVPLVVMMLASRDMRVALVTTHLPLKDVPAAIDRNRLRSIIDILVADLRKWFGIQSPRILVAGLNPHAGENGYLGREEIEVIIPELVAGRARGYDLIGPLPADTLFTPKVLQGADAVLAMYHDQGLPVLKYQSFGSAANITLGLPFVRTSVDHGTAFDLAGTRRADLGSLKTAVQVALDMTAVGPGS